MAARGSTAGTPRWVKVVGIITLIVALLVGIMLVGGNHGPGRHTRRPPAAAMRA